MKTISGILAKRFDDYIKFPDAQQAEQVKTGFQAIANFPNVIGLIDGTHIKVTVLKTKQDLFRNRKQEITVNCQAIVNHNMEFTNFVCRWPGSTHDSRVFSNSQICDQLQENSFGGYLLGDSGYGCKKYLLTPFTSARQQTEAERRYQCAHILTRNLIERTFGAFKSKFRCCLQGIRTAMPTTLDIILACVMLWNFIKQQGTAGDQFSSGDDEESERNQPTTDSRTGVEADLEADHLLRRQTSEGTTLRARLVERHFSRT